VQNADKKGSEMVKPFIIAWVLLGAIILIANLLLPENRFVLGAALLATVAVATPLLREWLRRKREGFYVNTKGNADGGDVIYNEDGKSLTFYFDRGARTIHIPSNRKWEEAMPEWAKGRKVEILERVRKRMGNNWTFEDSSE
jgi:hypothetical protein